MSTWSMDRDGVVLTADSARQWLHEVLADRDQVGVHWDDLVGIDKGLGIRPPLIWAAYLKHRDGIMEVRELWDSLNDGLRAWMVVLDDDEIGQLINMIVDDAIMHYQVPVTANPRDRFRQAFDLGEGQGDWCLWNRELGRPFTKAEAERAVVQFVMNGERQDILDRLAEWNDDLKTMLAAIPLDSEPATMELVRTVVKDIVEKEYYEGPET
jgi:hypothetical protein